jgi:hypothetical protein
MPPELFKSKWICVNNINTLYIFNTGESTEVEMANLGSKMASIPTTSLCGGVGGFKLSSGCDVDVIRR